LFAIINKALILLSYGLSLIFDLKTSMGGVHKEVCKHQLKVWVLKNNYFTTYCKWCNWWNLSSKFQGFGYKKYATWNSWKRD